MEAPKNEPNERILNLIEEDHENFLRRIKNRFDRVGVESPKIEVRFENVSIDADVYVASREIPTLLYAALNIVESILGLFLDFPSKKRKVNILKDVSGIIKPSRMTLLLGQPGAGKTTLLLALAGKLDKDLRVSGKVTYCGHELSKFVPQRLCSFVYQHDLHIGLMTPRETLDFSSRSRGVGSRCEMLEEILRREKEEGIEADPEIDAFMKATTMASQENSLITDYVLKILGLEPCSNTIVGDMMRRGISGGEKKRVTIGEMLVRPARVLLMDEISTGLDSATTFRICKYLSQMVHISDVTMVTSLLQPTPETYELFDDVILLSEGQIVYQGPREAVLEFFEYTGFKCPERKGVADFVQEVTSRKDQKQYWCKDQAYRYVSVTDFATAFKSFSVGQRLEADLKVPYEESEDSGLFATEKYRTPNWDLFKACLSREWLLIKRFYLFYALKIVLIAITSVTAVTLFIKDEMKAGSVEDGEKFLGAMYFSLISLMFTAMVEVVMFVLRLPIFYKQRDLSFYPAWAFGIPILLLRIPISIIESGLWVVLTYYGIGFAPATSRFFKQFLALLAVYQMAVSLALLIGAIGRIQIVANALGILVYAIFTILGGFFIAKNDFKPWLSWTTYLSPVMYGQNAIVINEFLDKRWSNANGESTVGKVILESIGVATEEHWFWVSIGALVGFILLLDVLFIGALTYLSPLRESKAFVPDEKSDTMENNSSLRGVPVNPDEFSDVNDSKLPPKRPSVLPVQPVSLAFNHVNYFVDMPAELKSLGVEGDRLQLLQDVSGAFRPGTLTAIVGVSGAGKTTLLDVLAGRKTAGYFEGSISVSGYPKNQETFARVSGYCEQSDILSPNITIYETLMYSAWLRLSNDISTEAKMMFIEEVMELLEISSIREALVGVPCVNGLSIEQRKRLKIAMELVANPSIIFMDEPTSGLDARAAAIVMRTLRNTVDSGRTVVCTIHQPSIDIFEAFDESLLMKLGGQVIYSGPLGRHSRELIEFFEGIPGIPKIKAGYNPASWVLEITSPEIEAQLNVNLAEIYFKSSLYQKNQEIVEELSTQTPGSKDLYFPTKYSQPFSVQFKACFWKQHMSYLRNLRYFSMRFFLTIAIGFLLGLAFWKQGQKIKKEQDVMNLLGSMYITVMFIGGNNSNSIQSIVDVERTVFYRERAVGMYSAPAYALAQVGIEIIYTTIQASVLSLLAFSMFGFEWTLGNFFWFYYFTLMLLTYMTMSGMMVVSLSPSLEVSSVLSSFLIRLWNLFAGFFIFRTQIPIWWRWCYWASPTAWTLYGLVTSQVGGKEANLGVPGQTNTIPLKIFLEKKLGYEFEFLPSVALAHVIWVIVFIVVFVCAIKYLNFQKR